MTAAEKVTLGWRVRHQSEPGHYLCENGNFWIYRSAASGTVALFTSFDAAQRADNSMLAHGVIVRIVRKVTPPATYYAIEWSSVNSYERYYLASNRRWTVLGSQMAKFYDQNQAETLAVALRPCDSTTTIRVVPVGRFT